MKINEILGIKYPFIQGGMAHIASGKFAAQVSNAGGLGLIATGGISLSKIKEEIEICKSLTDKPFGVNILMLHREIEGIIDLVCDSKIKLVTSGAGNPAPYIKRLKESGALVYPVVSNKALAIRMERAGADGIIAEGLEAGGHIGDLTTMVLMNEIQGQINIPLVCAGGIGSGKQVLAAEVLGATGVQLGTILLGAEECPIHENYKDKIIKAKSSHVTVIGRIKGYPTRLLKNSFSNNYIEKEKSNASVEDLELLMVGSLKKAVYDGNIVNGSLMCGQVVDCIKEIRPLKEIFESLYRDYKEEKRNLCQR